MRCIMWTGIDAAGLGMVMTQITRGSFDAHAGYFPARMGWIV